MGHTWLPVLHPEGASYGGGLYSIVIGMGVASFAYWSTDFLVIQRALAARDLDAAQKTPLIATFPKMFFPVLTVLPGLAALLVIPHQIQGNYSMVLPLMFLHYYPAGLLGIGITALLSSFMSGMAGNVTAFNTVWTYDVYQNYIAPGRPDHHYLNVGRVVTLVGILISIATAYSARAFPNIFDYWALLSSIFVGAPFATFVLGAFTRRVDGTAAFAGMLTGILATIGNFVLYHYGYVHYGSDLAMDFDGAAVGFFANVLVAWLFTILRSPAVKQPVVRWMHSDVAAKRQPWFLTPPAIAVLSAAMAIALNVIFW
jgi:SSS family solute:Na+ symporter